MSKTATTAPPPGLRWHKFLRRVWKFGLGLLVILLVAFLLLPVWISNEQGRLYVLDRLNDRLHGPKVAVDQWSLGWFRKTQLTNLRILQPDGTTLFACPRVSSGLTLWDIFWGRYDVGNTTADNCEMYIVRHADGTTSLDSLAAGAADILRAARGAIQINNGQLTIVSERAGQSAKYIDVKAVINVASPDAPFHVQASAVGSWSGAESSISLRATFPPTRSMSAKRQRHPGIWEMLTDVDFAANRLPTALVCDYAGADGRWVGSLGETLEAISFSGHAIPAQDNIRLSAIIRGTARAGETPLIDARLLLHMPGKDGKGATLSIPSPAADYHAAVNVRFSPPLAQVLGRLNPILAEASVGSGGGLVRGTVSWLMLPLDDLGDGTGAARLTFPPLLFTARDGPSVVRQLQVLTGELPRPTTTARSEGSAEVMLVRLGDGQFSYENFRVTLGHSRINFSGSVGVAGRLDLLATVPVVTPGLSAGSTTVVIKGTVESPLMQRAE